MGPLHGNRPPGEAARLAALRPALETRHRVLQALRRWFGEAGFLEVQTPVRVPVPALELHIDAVPAEGGYLRTSPELHMKRLLAAGYERLFQIGPCFRQGEQGDRHQPEFTLLEWYRARAGYREVLDDTIALLTAAVRAAAGGETFGWGGRTIRVAPPWDTWTVRDVFRRFAGWDPIEAFDAERFDLDLVTKVEPRLPPDRPVILMDYPAAVAALARCKPDDPRVAERWELYLGGVELANAFSELTDPVEQRRRFEDWAAQRRAQGRPVYPLDDAFVTALEHGLPECGGVALGVDRLVMLLAGAATLADALPFPTGDR
jgi:lysyl-tRNA synthetase class 2